MAANQLGSVQHIVQLMLENRSFDHMLGFLYRDAGNVSPLGHPFEGLTGTETNLDTAGNPVQVFEIDASKPGAYFMPGANPGEGYVNTNAQLFGTTTEPVPAVAANAGFVTNFDAAIAYDKAHHYKLEAGTTASDIMGIFPPSALPVLSGLAKGFAVCDHWFSSAPTETMPNRAFACTATSQGHMNDATKSFTVRSIFGLLTEHAQSWKIYGYTASPLTRLDFPDTVMASDANFGQFSDFQQDAASGSLPAYSFLEPSWGATGNSQHPNYDVALGEQLILDVYRALRDGPAWSQTLLIITYDEHGGCYDHVPPPLGAALPDATIGEYGFDFTRFGVRVPAVLVSPLIAAGTVFRVPDGATPIDHTSVLKTIEVRWGLPALTARDAAAPDLGDALTLDAPRTDDPLAGVTAPVSTGANPAAGTVSHLMQVQAELVSNLPAPLERVHAAPLLAQQHTPADFDHYITARTALWQSSRDEDAVPPT
jgi:phospholipase C